MAFSSLIDALRWLERRGVPTSAETINKIVFDFLTETDGKTQTYRAMRAYTDMSDFGGSQDIITQPFVLFMKKV